MHMMYAPCVESEYFRCEHHTVRSMPPPAWSAREKAPEDELARKVNNMLQSLRLGRPCLLAYISQSTEASTFDMRAMHRASLHPAARSRLMPTTNPRYRSTSSTLQKCPKHPGFPVPTQKLAITPVDHRDQRHWRISCMASTRALVPLLHTVLHRHARSRDPPRSQPSPTADAPLPPAHPRDVPRRRPRRRRPVHPAPPPPCAPPQYSGPRTAVPDRARRAVRRRVPRRHGAYRRRTRQYPARERAPEERSCHGRSQGQRARTRTRRQGHLIRRIGVGRRASSRQRRRR